MGRHHTLYILSIIFYIFSFLFSNTSALDVQIVANTVYTFEPSCTKAPFNFFSDEDIKSYLFNSAITAKSSSSTATPQPSITFYQTPSKNELYFCTQKWSKNDDSAQDEMQDNESQTSMFFGFNKNNEQPGDVIPMNLDGTKTQMSFEFDSQGKEWMVFPYIYQQFSDQGMSETLFNPTVWIDHIEYSQGESNIAKVYINFYDKISSKSLEGDFYITYTAFEYEDEAEQDSVNDEEDTSDEGSYNVKYTIEKQSGNFAFTWPEWTEEGDAIGFCQHIEFEEFSNIPVGFMSMKMTTTIDSSNTNSSQDANSDQNGILYWIEHIDQKGMTMCASVTNPSIGASKFSGKEAEFYYVAQSVIENSSMVSTISTFTFETQDGFEICQTVQSPSNDKYFMSDLSYECNYNNSFVTITLEGISYSNSSAAAWFEVSNNMNMHFSEDYKVDDFAEHFGTAFMSICKSDVFDFCQEYADVTSSCKQGNHFNFESQKCICNGFHGNDSCEACPDGQYTDIYNNICIPCDNGIKSDGFCYDCKMGTFNGEDTCECNQGYKQNMNGICTLCDEGYGKMNEEADKCISCNNGSVDIYGYCKCNIGYGFNNNECEQCGLNQFSYDSQCHNCVYGTISESNDSCICDEGYSGISCTECQDSYIMHEGVCNYCSGYISEGQCFCPPFSGFKDKFGICVPSSEIDSSEDCPAGTFYEDSKQKCLCQKDFGFMSDSDWTCISCIGKHQNIDTTTGNCYCDVGYELDENFQCENCSQYYNFIDGECLCSGTSYYEDPNCKPCNANSYSTGSFCVCDEHNGWFATYSTMDTLNQACLKCDEYSIIIEDTCHSCNIHSSVYDAYSCTCDNDYEPSEETKESKHPYCIPKGNKILISDNETLDCNPHSTSVNGYYCACNKGFVATDETNYTVYPTCICEGSNSFISTDGECVSCGQYSMVDGNSCSCQDPLVPTPETESSITPECICPEEDQILEDSCTLCNENSTKKDYYSCVCNEGYIPTKKTENDSNPICKLKCDEGQVMIDEDGNCEDCGEFSSPVDAYTCQCNPNYMATFKTQQDRNPICKPECGEDQVMNENGECTNCGEFSYPFDYYSCRCDYLYIATKNTKDDNFPKCLKSCPAGQIMIDEEGTCKECEDNSNAETYQCVCYDTFVSTNGTEDAIPTCECEPNSIIMNNKCVKCKINSEKKDDNTCGCMDGYLQLTNEKNPICLKNPCDGSNAAVTLIYSGENDSTLPPTVNCESCGSGAHQIESVGDTFKCACDDDFIEVPGSDPDKPLCAKACEDSQVMDTSGTCVSCNADSEKQDDYSCSCSDGFINVTPESNIPSCFKKCEDDNKILDEQGECQSCIDGSTKVDEITCACNNGLIPALDTSQTMPKCYESCDDFSIMDKDGQCQKCNENASKKDEYFCECNFKYVAKTDSNNPECVEKCSHSEVLDENLECKECKTNSHPSDDKCVCDEGMIASPSTSGEAFPTCFLSCDDNSYMSNDNGICVKCPDESSSNAYGCTCNNEEFIFQDSSCVACNANSHKVDEYTCECDAGFWASPDTQSSQNPTCYVACESENSYMTSDGTCYECYATSNGKYSCYCSEIPNWPAIPMMSDFDNPICQDIACGPRSFYIHLTNHECLSCPEHSIRSDDDSKCKCNDGFKNINEINGPEPICVCSSSNAILEKGNCVDCKAGSSPNAFEDKCECGDDYTASLETKSNKYPSCFKKCGTNEITSYYGVCVKCNENSVPHLGKCECKEGYEPVKDNENSDQAICVEKCPPNSSRDESDPEKCKCNPGFSDTSGNAKPECTPDSSRLRSLEETTCTPLFASMTLSINCPYTVKTSCMTDDEETGFYYHQQTTNSEKDNSIYQFVNDDCTFESTEAACEWSDYTNSHVACPTNLESFVTETSYLYITEDGSMEMIEESSSGADTGLIIGVVIAVIVVVACVVAAIYYIQNKKKKEQQAQTV